MATKMTDMYGFELTVDAQTAEVLKAADAIAQQQELAWKPYIEKNRLSNSEAKLKEMVRKGVPPTMRTWVWMETSGALKKKAQYPASNYYANMVSAGASSPYIGDINKDIVHTFPSHGYLGSKDGQDAMRRVLSAYACHNDKVGYCSSMNNIVALLLVAMNRNEENAFWLLATLVEDILHPHTYDKKLAGCAVEMRALDELAAEKFPALHAHLAALGADISLAATDWFLSLYAASMPAETVARIWDSLFNEGPKIIFRVALALLKLVEGRVMKTDNAGDAILALRAGAASMHGRDDLMATAFDGIGSLAMAVIEKYRQEMEGGAGSSGSGAGGMDMKDMKKELQEVGKEMKAGLKQGLGFLKSGLNKASAALKKDKE